MAEAMFETVRAAVHAAGDQLMAFGNPEMAAAGLKSPVHDWPMMQFEQAFAMAAGYLLFVLVGSAVMKAIYGPDSAPSVRGGSVLEKFSREPITILQAAYNLFQVFLCAYMIFEALREYNEQGYKLLCNKFDPTAKGMARITWIFYMSKIADFCDTFFMVMRRKWRQISFLHVYHHTSIFLFYWLNSNVAFDGDVYYTVALNGFIHLVMYSYYLLTTFNVPVPIAIKHFVTRAQLIQFVTMMGQAVFIIVFSCPFPRNVTLTYLVYIFSLFLLFKNFEAKTYKKKKSA